MARGRMISKSLSTSEKFASLVSSAGRLAEFCHALYPLMVAHADDFGRLQGDVFTVKHVCYPASRRSLDEFDAGLRFMDGSDLITYYAIGSKKFVQINNFEPHQQGLHKRTRSQFPEPPGTPRNFQDIPTEEKGTEEKRTERKKSVSPEPESGSVPTTAPTGVLAFPTIGQGGPVWWLSEAQVAEWASLYPGLSILTEAQKALAWIKADLGRRKTAGGMRKFLVGWFNRAVNDRRGQTTAPAARTTVGSRIETTLSAAAEILSQPDVPGRPRR